MGSDSLPNLAITPLGDFNPRSPDGERLLKVDKKENNSKISIHAPRMGSDVSPMAYSTASERFQSTLPGWGATKALATADVANSFQSTLPGWGATAKMDIFAHDMGKIIHFQH